MATHQAPGHPPAECTAEKFGRCVLCERITPGSPKYSEHYRRLFHPEEFPAPAPAPQRRAKAPRPSVARDIANIAAMKACPHWEAATDCGCSLNRCRAGKGRDGVVSHRDCFACLEKTGIKNESPP